MTKEPTVENTIFALASGPGIAGVAVIRFSGARCKEIFEAMAGGAPEPRLATRCFLKHPYTEEIIDDGLMLFFPAPASFTGEDVGEFQIHGGRAVVEFCLAAIGRFKGVRMAEPGEFTRRAFENGKLDLTQVEGLADLISAKTEAQRRQAVRVASGETGAVYEGWRKELIRCLAFFETDIDFVEEDDVPENVTREAASQVEKLFGEIGSFLDDPRKGEKLRDGFRVVIAGVPNVGKSTLLNRLAKREAAIVSDVAGTTRDVVEVYLDLAGLPVVISDTAGLREARDEIESIGVARARATIEEAELIIWLCDERGIWPQEATSPFDSEAIWAANKADLAAPTVIAGPKSETVQNLSAKQGVGFTDLLKVLARFAQENFAGLEASIITRRRHREALKSCASFLRAALTEIARDEVQSELVAEHLRLAARMLGRITGRIDVEDLLDVIFADFCIGK
ncbi:MAG: tRNA uridine-5-carboxymethylaminomethyl(34) synthesis GTPase MnmE [Hyphomicrobiales bacterium]